MAIGEQVKLAFAAGVGVFGLFFSSMGLLTAVTAVRKYRINAQRERFEPVEARVLNSEVERSSISEKRKYDSVIEYEYEVENETFVSTSVYPGPDAKRFSQRSVAEVVERYPEGETVEAFYDPEDPSVAFLENESVLGQSVVYSMVAVVALTVGVGLVGGAVFWVL